MPKAVITHDKDLPEIPDQKPHLPPVAYLRLDKALGVAGNMPMVINPITQQDQQPLQLAHPGNGLSVGRWGAK
jgi:hypothetical protein